MDKNKEAEADTELEAGIDATVGLLVRLARIFPFRASREARRMLDVVTDMNAADRARLEKLVRERPEDAG